MGFILLAAHWFWVVLLVVTLIVIHAIASNLATEATTEVHMEKSKQNQMTALKNPNLLLLSFTNTAWAIGTSVAAGALSA